MRTFLLAVVLGCGGTDDKDDPDGDVGPPDAGDADTDTDTDADADTDSDADTDLGPTGDTSSAPPEPTCDDASTSPLPQAEFQALYEQKFCWVWTNTCGESGPCPTPPPLDLQCTFLPTPACACLDATWSCAGGTPTLAPACAQAYECEDTGWWIETGTWTESGDTGGTGTGTGGGGSGGWGGSGTTTTPPGGSATLPTGGSGTSTSTIGGSGP